MTPESSSVLIVSYRRTIFLEKCLAGLSRQVVPSGEVLVVWQGDDTATRDTAESARGSLSCRLVLVHSEQAGVVAAENAGLDAAKGELILLLDDDVVPPTDWVARHVAWYQDPRIGAVGGSAVNHRISDGAPFPSRSVEPIGVIGWSGRLLGNMHDLPPAWRSRPPIDVDHLVGYNMSLRRVAFDRFESGLRRYWQMFEADACLQVKARGFRIVFDFANVVDHYPTNATYDGRREGDLTTKIYNGAYNHAFILAKHSPALLRPCRFLQMFLIGTTASPGLLAWFVCLARYGHPRRETEVLFQTWRARLQGWSAGRKVQRSRNAPVPINA